MYGHFTLDQVLSSYLLVKESWGTVVKNIPASAEDTEMWAWSLGQEDSLE